MIFVLEMNLYQMRYLLNVADILIYNKVHYLIQYSDVPDTVLSIHNIHILIQHTL